MATLAELRSEHEAVLQKMQVLQESIVLLVAGQIVEAMPGIHDCENFIKKGILPHFELEERVIFPLLAGQSDNSNALAAQLKEEHVLLRSYFDRYCSLVEKNPSDPQLQEISREMSAKLLEHAHREDMLVIPLIRQYLSIAETDELPTHAPPLIYPEPQ